MRVILFGSTGMVGQGVLRECIEDPAITQVLLVVRKPVGTTSSKLTELVHDDFFNWTNVEQSFAGYDACFFCLGVSSVGMKEPDYRRTTYDLTLNVAETLARVGSLRTFIYVSGQNTDANGRQMWQRVKGATENALIEMPFSQIFCFRPGYIQPMHGVRSKVGWYNTIYSCLSWAYPLLRKAFAGYVTSTEEVGRAMISVARDGYTRRILETADIHVAAGE